MSLRASCSHSVLGACSSLCVGWSSWFVLAVAGLLCSVVRDLVEWYVSMYCLPCDGLLGLCHGLCHSVSLVFLCDLVVL